MEVLYTDVDFTSSGFEAMRSRREGDGGFSPGRPILAEDAERFGGRPFPEILKSIVGDAKPKEGIGGSSALSLIRAARMLEGMDIEVALHGARGDDERSSRLLQLLRRAPLGLRRYRAAKGPCPSTIVLSDPRRNGGRGGLCRVDELGAAARFLPSELGEDFRGADIVAFGGTALVPALHDALQELLIDVHSRGALSVVSTVFDPRAERRDPVGPWPLGLHDSEADDFPGPADSYRHCDLLVMDADEALRLSGSRDLAESLSFFEGSGLGAFLIVREDASVLAWARRGRFAPLSLTELPAPAPSAAATKGAMGDAGYRGDAGYYGDTLAGGVLAALALQMKAAKGHALDLKDAASRGIAASADASAGAGATACTDAARSKK